MHFHAFNNQTEEINAGTLNQHKLISGFIGMATAHNTRKRVLQYEKIDR